VTAVLGLQPALDSRCHWTKFISDSAVGAADDRVQIGLTFNSQLTVACDRPSRTIRFNCGIDAVLVDYPQENLANSTESLQLAKRDTVVSQKRFHASKVKGGA